MDEHNHDHSAWERGPVTEAMDKKCQQIRRQTSTGYTVENGIVSCGSYELYKDSKTMLKQIK